MNWAGQLAVATVAAVGLYAPAVALPSVDSCTSVTVVAGAAPTPSPSCGGDLRECLRQSADMRQTTFGGRYVTAEDVARCVEAFDACAHGGASRGGNTKPPGSSSRGGETSSSAPPVKRFTVADSVAFDCQVNGNAVACDITRRDQLPDTMDSWTAQFTGKTSDSTMSGTQTTKIQAHYTAEYCIENSEGIEKVSYTFNPDRTVTIKSDGIQWHTANCAESHDQTTPPNESTIAWSPTG